MAAEKKAKKDKEIVLEVENQIRDIRQQMADQIRCLDQHLDCHVGMLLDMQEYYRRHSEVEIEFSRTLDKLAKQLSVRQRSYQLGGGYSTHVTWHMLMESTRQKSKNHGFLGDVMNPIMVNRLSEIHEDIQRIHKRCREMVTNHQEEIFKVLTELESAMKTYHTYHGYSQQAETKLLRVQSQRVKVDQQNALSKRFINYDKKAEQKQAKYAENKLKALKARNEYLLCIDTANAALHKYFQEDFPKLVRKMDFGYHKTLTQVINCHVTADKCVVNSDQDRLTVFMNQVKDISESQDNTHFCSQNPKIFSIPDSFEFQPHRGDDICQISAQKAVQDDILCRLCSIKERIDSNKKENQERIKAMESTEVELLNRISYIDTDIVQLFKDDKSALKSPTDKERRREERIKLEDTYLQLFHEYMKGDSLIVRLNSKFISLRKALGEGSFDTLPPGYRDHVRKRPPSLPPKPKKPLKKDKPACDSQPKLFGGTIEEYVEAMELPIPLVVRSCIRAINLYGLHHQGIFRVSGSQNDINNYKQQFERGVDVIASKVEGDDINSVAGLLKLYFRELKEPLFPPEMFNDLITNAEKFSGNEEECKAQLRSILCMLPRQRVVVMRYLFAFLNHISEFSDENMMDAYNLAICFGPTLVPAPVSSDLSNHVYVNKLIENLIIHYEDIFPCDEDMVLYEKCIVDYGEKDYLDSMSDDDLLNSNIPDDDDDIEDHEAIAEYDYQGRSEKELSFKKGDVLMVFSRITSDWWNGEFMGQKGLIPDKYIQLMNKSLREQPSNLNKGSTQAKSSDCLLSPDDIHSSTSSLDRSVSQPNVAVPVSSLPQLGIPRADLLPNVTHTSQMAEDQGSLDNVVPSLDCSTSKVTHDLTTSSQDYSDKLKLGKAKNTSSETNLDFLIPVPEHPSQSPTAAESVADSSITKSKQCLSSFGNVRKSTSFRGYGEGSTEKDYGRVLAQVSSANVSHNSDDDANFTDKQVGSTLVSSSVFQKSPIDKKTTEGKKNTKASTLPPNMNPPHYGMHSTSECDSELFKEIQFSTIPRSSPGDKPQRVVPPVKPRPPNKKSNDTSKTFPSGNDSISIENATPVSVPLPATESVSKRL